MFTNSLEKETFRAAGDTTPGLFRKLCSTVRPGSMLKPVTAVVAGGIFVFDGPQCLCTEMMQAHTDTEVRNVS